MPITFMINLTGQASIISERIRLIGLSKTTQGEGIGLLDLDADPSLSANHWR